MLDQITGNQSAKDLIRKMLRSGRVPGALLFSGEEGVGKKLFALEIAKAVNCRQPQEMEACGKCPACKRIAHFNFPQTDDPDEWKKIIWTDHGDVCIVVGQKRVLYVEQMRQIEREANYRPFEGKARVFLIEEAEKLNDSSSNALLKILEEPPPTSHLILLTSRPAALLPTIRSRCQTVRFSPLSVPEIEQHLVQNKLAPAADARLIARCAGGSLGRALRSDLETYKEHRQIMMQILKALTLSADLSQLMRGAETINEARYKDDYEFNLELLETLIRDTLLLSVGGSEDQLTNVDLLPELQRIAERMNTRSATVWISKIEELRDQLTVNINRKIATDALFMTMASTA